MNSHPQYQPNQISRTLQSIIGLNPFSDHDSAPRLQMLGSHLGQRLITKGMTERYMDTGMGQEFGKYTFAIKMPVNGRILKVIERYRRTMDDNSIGLNPETLVIYEDELTKEIGSISLPTFCSYHPYFGFTYKPQPGLSKIRVGNYVEKDTILLDAPTKTADGNWMYGTELNVCHMSHPSVSEDGVMICRDVLDRFTFTTTETRVVEWGKKDFLLNLYGTDEVYKCFPEIGDYVNPDGILAAMRQHNIELSPIEQSAEALRRVDHNFDTCIYAGGVGGRIIDIRVNTNGDYDLEQTPTDRQIGKYATETRRFYKDILACWREITAERKRRNMAVNLTRGFHTLVLEALIATEDEKGTKISKLYRRAPLDTFRVEFVIEFKITPNRGFKFTDFHGGKGVVCHIAEPWEMPVDSDGNRADYVMDPGSRGNRMNIGGLYEIYVNAASRDVGKHVRRMVGLERGDKATLGKLTEQYRQDPTRINEAFQYLLGYYKIIAPRMYQFYTNEQVATEELLAHMTKVVQDHVYLYMPPEYSPEYHMAVELLEQQYRPVFGPVDYIGYSGEKVRTIENVRIGSMAVMMLEKTGNDWSATPTARVQHFGVLAPLTKSDKNSSPIREQPGKIVGETEGRIYRAYAGPEAVAEIIDRNNNPRAAKIITEGILNAHKPTAIPKLIDRKEMPYGSSKPLQLINHIAMCGGWQFRYKSQKLRRQMGEH